jgi:hypothetical protein
MLGRLREYHVIRFVEVPAVLDAVPDAMVAA